MSALDGGRSVVPVLGRDRSGGALVDRAVMLARPDMLTAAEFAERFGMTTELVGKRSVAGKLLALRAQAKQRLRYPVWQGKLLGDPLSRKRFELLLSVLGTSDRWSAYDFFCHRCPALGLRTPVEVWRERSETELLRAAEAWARA